MNNENFNIKTFLDLAEIMFMTHIELNQFDEALEIIQLLSILPFIIPPQEKKIINPKFNIEIKGSFSKEQVNNIREGLINLISSQI